MSTFAALADYGACAREWVRMSSRHRLARPDDHLGMRLDFKDGTMSRVFRETVVVDAASSDPVLLVIAFRLAFLGDVELLHVGFRHECLIHTPLFAGFPGFARSCGWGMTARGSTAACISGRERRRRAPTRGGWSGCSRHSRTAGRPDTTSCQGCVERITFATQK